MWKTVCKSCAVTGRYVRTNVFSGKAIMCTQIGHSIEAHFSLGVPKMLTILAFRSQGVDTKSQPLRQRLSAGRCHFQLRPKEEGIGLRGCLEKVPSGAVEGQAKREAKPVSFVFPEEELVSGADSVSGVPGKVVLLGISGSYLEVARQAIGPETARRPWLDVSGFVTYVVAKTRRHFVTHETGSLNP